MIKRGRTKLCAMMLIGTLCLAGCKTNETFDVQAPGEMKANEKGEAETAYFKELEANTTRYVTFPFGLPSNTPKNGVIGQILRGENAPAKCLVIGKVVAIAGSTKTSVPNEWFELSPMTEGNYNLTWQAPAGVNLANYDGVEITIHRIVNGRAEIEKQIGIAKN